MTCRVVCDCCGDYSANNAKTFRHISNLNQLISNVKNFIDEFGEVDSFTIYLYSDSGNLIGEYNWNIDSMTSEGYDNDER